MAHASTQSQLQVSNLFNFSNHVCLVTGGATGIGEMAAQGFVQNGAKVYIASRKESELKATTERLNKLGPGTCEYVVADLKDKAGCDKLVAEMKKRTDRLTVLVNNTGVTWGAPYDDFPESGWDKLMALNVKSIFYMTVGLEPLLLNGTSADMPSRVINIASMAGITTVDVTSGDDGGLAAPGHGTFSYGPSKAACIHLSRMQSSKLAPKNIMVNCVCPGVFPSRMTSFGMDKFKDTLTAYQPTGRVGKPSDLAGLILFLSSYGSAHMTGNVIEIDGGSTRSGWRRKSKNEKLIIGITITLVGASVNISEGVVKLISHIKNTPNELLQASNDVSDFRGVLLHIEHSVREEETLRQALRSNRQARLALPDLRNVPAAAPEAPELLRRAEGYLAEIEEIVREFTQLQNARGFAAFGCIRVLDRRRLKVLRDELKNLKIVGQLMGIAPVPYARVWSSITRLFQEVSRGARESEDQRIMLHRILQQVNLIANDEGRRHVQEPIVEGPPGVAFPQLEAAPADGNVATPSNVSHSDSVSQSSSIFKLDVSRDISRFRKGACRSFCSCICHKRYRKRAPTLANKLLGSLFLGYSNIPFFAVKCDEPSTCVRPSSFSATFTYYFPTWFVIQQMFSLVLAKTPLGDPAFVLKIRKIQYMDFRMFRMASIGDWRGIRSLLNKGGVHPSATCWGGWSPLHYAISYGHAAVCKELLSRNADPLLEDGDNQQSALEYVWMKILGKAFAPQRLLEFESIFANSECLEEFGFSTLHKIVLGLHGGSLPGELNGYPGSINAVDNGGRTALSWAAQRGDIESLTVLLSYGADHSISNKARTTPLHCAVEARNPTWIIPLLQAGADPNAPDHRLHTPLHMACKTADDIRYIQPLLTSGADPNAMTDYDYSPSSLLPRATTVDP